MTAERFVESRDAIAARIAKRVESAANAAIGQRGVFTIAIAGGSVADSCLPLIARLPLVWDKVHIFWCDERAVPIDNPDSNAGAALKLWHDTPLSRGAVLHVMNGGVSDFGAVVTQYSATLEQFAGKPPTLDVVLLGVGEDGHVASLFPGHTSLDVTNRSVLLETASPKPPAMRLTLSLPVLAGARDVIVAAFGEAKANAMRQALEDATAPTPIARVLRQATHASVMLDPAAASQLGAAAT
jgi:6-phosphogluconolactonase